MERGTIRKRFASKSIMVVLIVIIAFWMTMRYYKTVYLPYREYQRQILVDTPFKCPSLLIPLKDGLLLGVIPTGNGLEKLKAVVADFGFESGKINLKYKKANNKILYNKTLSPESKKTKTAQLHNQRITALKQLCNSI